MSMATSVATISTGMVSNKKENNLLDFLFHTKLNTFVGTLNSPQDLKMFVSGVQTIPEVNTERITSNEIQIKLEKPNQHHSERESTLNEEMVEVIHKMTNFPHDFTFSCFSDKTDKKMAILGSRGELDNNLSPDEILLLGEVAVVIEYTTMQTYTTKQHAEQKFKDKMVKYYQALEMRKTDWALNYFVVIVSKDAVYSNMDDISTYWVDELVVRFRLAMSVADQMRERHGIDLFSHSKLTELEKSVKNLLQSVPLTLTSGLIAPEDKEWLTRTRVDKLLLENQINYAFKTADSEYKEANADYSAKGISKTREKQERRIQDLMDILPKMAKEQVNSRNDLKRVVQMPLIVLTNGPNDGRLMLEGLQYPEYRHESGCISHKLFSQAFEAASRQETYWHDHDYMEIDLADMGDEERMLLEEARKETRRSYQRFTTEFNEDELVDLAIAGVGYKSMDHRVKVHIDDKREIKKFPFSPFTFTDDIDLFVEDESLYQSSYLPFSITDNSLTNLISEAYSASGSKSEASVPQINHLRNYLNSRLGRSMKFISDVATELAISLRQNCKKSEWILKRIRGTRAYVMIHPTRSDSHIFYSIAWPRMDKMYEMNNSCVRDYDVLEDWCFTEIVSSNKSKLTNLVSSQSKVLSIIAMACEQSRFPLCTGASLFDSSNEFSHERKMAIRFSNVCLLSLLHDKGFVDEAMSEARYLCMEGFVVRPTLPNPGKRLVDLSSVIRSRMHLWVYKKLINGAIKLINNYGYHVQKIEHNSERRTWFGLFDVFTGNEYQDPTQLINSFYYNYLHNKDEDPEKNSSYKIMKKILEWEDKFPKKMDYLGKEDHVNLDLFETMEFSPNLLLHCCDVASRKAFPGRERWRDDLDAEIIREMSKITLESICTLKVSAAFTELNMDRIGSRPRVMLAMKNLVKDAGLKDSSTVAHLINHCLEDLHSKPGLMVDTFPKAQHGGFREILVLSASARVIQLMIETISRTICSHFPSEIMTHPERKLKTPGFHSFQAKKMMGGKTLTVCTSDDAKKWNQGHVVTKFMMMLLYFTKPHFHNFIISSLDLWLQKNIMIPNNLLDMIDNMTLYSLEKKPFANEVCNQLAKCRLGGEEAPWMKPRSSYVTTKSGMLQGILHYTSSLFHTIVQETMPNIFLNIFPRNSKILVTPMQSSDDSALLITSQVNEKGDQMTNYIRSCICFYMKHKISKALGIYLSSKSTIGTINIMEFNSEFFDHGSLIRPVDKWVFACTVPPESGSLYSRQEHFKNLHSAILEGGGSIFLTAQCQISQALLYYRMLGMSLNPVFSRFESEIRELRDPSLGFFMLDDPVISGLGTCKFNLYLNLKNSSLLNAKYKAMLNANIDSKVNTRNESERRQIIQTLSTSAVSSTSLIVYGQCNRYKRLLQMLANPEDWREQLDENPDLLYRQSENFAEFCLKLAQKSHAPGVVDSLSYTNVVVRAIASAAYILSRTILSVRDYSDPNQKKTSLMHAIRESLLYDSDSRMTLEDFSFLFPLCSGYESLIETKATVNFKLQQDIRKPKRMKNDVVIFEAPVDEFARMERVLRSKWFDHRVQLSKTLVEMRFLEYKKHLPWLRETAKETLLCSPFDHQDQLHDFIQKLEVSSRIVHLTCAPVQGSRGYTVLQKVIRNNQWPGYKLEEMAESHMITHRRTKDVLNQSIYQLAMSPILKAHKNTLVRQLLRNTDTITIPQTDRHRHPAISLYLIQKFCKTILKTSNNVDIDQIPRVNPVDKRMVDTQEVHILRQAINNWVAETQTLNCGIMGHYSKPQKFDPIAKCYKGLGVWVGKFNSTKIEIHIDSEENRGVYSNIVTHVKIKNETSFALDVVMMDMWLREHRCSIASSSYTPEHGEEIVNRLSPKGGFTNYSSNYTPVVKVMGFGFVDLTEDLYHLKDVCITLDKTALRLTGLYRQGNLRNRVTLVSYSISHTDSNLSRIDPKDVKLSNPLWQHWCARVPINKSFAGQLIDISVYEHDKPLENDLGAESKALLQKFWQDCFKSSCSRLGYTSYRNSCAVQELLDFPEEELLAAQQYGERIDLGAHIFDELDKLNLLADDIRDGEPTEEVDPNRIDVFDEFKGYFEQMGNYDADDGLGVETPPLSLTQRSELVEKYLLDEWVLSTFKSENMGNALPIFLKRKIVQKNIEDKIDVLLYLTGYDPKDCVMAGDEDEEEEGELDDSDLLDRAKLGPAEEMTEEGERGVDYEDLGKVGDTSLQPE